MIECSRDSLEKKYYITMSIKHAYAEGFEYSVVS